MTGQMVDGGCNPSVIRTGVLTCVYTQTHSHNNKTLRGRLRCNTGVWTTVGHTPYWVSVLRKRHNFLLEKKQVDHNKTKADSALCWNCLLDGWIAWETSSYFIGLGGRAVCLVISVTFWSCLSNMHTPNNSQTGSENVSSSYISMKLAFTIHPLGTMNVWTKLHLSPASSWDISVCNKVVDRLINWHT